MRSALLTERAQAADIHSPSISEGNNVIAHKVQTAAQPVEGPPLEYFSSLNHDSVADNGQGGHHHHPPRATLVSQFLPEP